MRSIRADMVSLCHYAAVCYASIKALKNVFRTVREKTNIIRWTSIELNKYQMMIVKHFVMSLSVITTWTCRYTHNQDWDNAERVAEQHDKSAVSDVLMSRAKVEFEAANYPRFEALMLRCHKPELIIKHYQVNAMVGL